jgi:hypothetical protein
MNFEMYVSAFRAEATLGREDGFFLFERPWHALRFLCAHSDPHLRLAVAIPGELRAQKYRAKLSVTVQDPGAVVPGATLTNDDLPFSGGNR